jgi:hypothetical protein
LLPLIYRIVKEILIARDLHRRKVEYIKSVKAYERDYERFQKERKVWTAMNFEEFIPAMA